MKREFDFALFFVNEDVFKYKGVELTLPITSRQLGIVVRMPRFQSSGPGSIPASDFFFFHFY